MIGDSIFKDNRTPERVQAFLGGGLNIRTIDSELNTLLDNKLCEIWLSKRMLKNFAEKLSENFKSPFMRMVMRDYIKTLDKQIVLLQEGLKQISIRNYNSRYENISSLTFLGNVIMDCSRKGIRKDSELIHLSREILCYENSGLGSLDLSLKSIRNNLSYRVLRIIEKENKNMCDWLQSAGEYFEK